MKKYQTVVYKCKKCNKTIEDTKNAQIDKENLIIVDGTPSFLILQTLFDHMTQRKYNKKYGTKNIRYKFGICKDCL